LEILFVPLSLSHSLYPHPQLLLPPISCSYRKLRLTGKLTHYCRVTARKVTPFAARPTHPACPALAQHASLMQEKERRVPSRVVRALMGGRAFVALA
jgi:hypothetical protein